MMMEKADFVSREVEIPDHESGEALAALYYFRSSLAKRPGNDLLIFLIEMTIVEVSSRSRADLSR